MGATYCYCHNTYCATTTRTLAAFQLSEHEQNFEKPRAALYVRVRTTAKSSYWNDGWSKMWRITYYMSMYVRTRICYSGINAIISIYRIRFWSLWVLISICKRIYVELDLFGNRRYFLATISFFSPILYLFSTYIYGRHVRTKTQFSWLKYSKGLFLPLCQTWNIT